ncbi:adenylate kinase [Borreliella garinii]|uniref:adenylate kinase n=1 Tax=Borreliella garinii TaxID=29519 RepID=UPI00018E27C8|nr:adenylate kinase [Borreliella garinii]EED30051.1 adenylate kinase (ATP-AMP transphosphorylase) [Borreliella garinii Far04]WNZ66636.1 adenylate kinase [Borreliella garinii]WNZ67631.1 adenylate kinase [Borreliella garinii]WNZ68629.1 adenylate kinase [Borreliella garinii]WNZ69629.1 adenylate kinase [Borreliella garinii]
MGLVFLGPPGSGKGTISKIISNEFKYHHISTGDLFRENILNSTTLGKEIKKIVEKGELVPDLITIKIVKNKIKAIEKNDNFILDGFPRNICQAEALDKFLPNVKIINFLINEKLVIKRLSGRRICKSCNNIFNIYTLATKKNGICDVCGGDLYQREDDKEECLKTRLKEYKLQTQPLIEFYSKCSRLNNIDASVEIDEIRKKIIKIMLKKNQ